MLEVAQHTDRAAPLIEHHDVTGAEGTTHFLDRGEVHRDIEVGGHEKGGRGTPWQHRTAFVAVFHPARMLLEDFIERSAERELPEPRPFYPPAQAIEFGTAVLAKAEAEKPVRATLDDVRHVA
jgi:hypothetical protein